MTKHKPTSVEQQLRSARPSLAPIREEEPPRRRTQRQSEIRAAFDAGRIWNGWTENLISIEDTYIIHAWIERKSAVARALCGARIADSGLLNLRDQEFIPGCLRCRSILEKAGLTIS